MREDLIIPASEMWFTSSRSSGPGGQHVNKTSSRVSLHWNAAESSALTSEQRERLMERLAPRISKQGVLQIDVDTHRSQHRNRQTARQRLAELVRDALAEPKKRVPTKTPARANQRRLEEKSRRGTVKQLRKPPTTDD